MPIGLARWSHWRLIDVNSSTALFWTEKLCFKPFIIINNAAVVMASAELLLKIFLKWHKHSEEGMAKKGGYFYILTFTVTDTT